MVRPILDSSGCQGPLATYAQLEGLWIANGGDKKKAPLAAAIAMAESGGCPSARSSNPDGGENIGLWQLDTKGKGAGVIASSLYFPATNAQVAVRASNNGKDWSAWSTYTSGAYKAFMSSSTTPDMNVPTAPGQQQQQQQGDPSACAFNLSIPGLSSIPLIGKNFDYCLISKTEVRAVMGGLLLVAGALVTMPGLAMVFAYGFKASGAAAATLRAAQFVPGGGTAARVARTAGAAYSRGGPQRAPAGRGGAGQASTRRGAAPGGGGPRGSGQATPRPPVTDPAAGV